MSENADVQENNPGLDAEAVANFLEKHPAFFIGRDDLLMQMRLPHDSGEAISLLEKQVQLLRERTQNQHNRIQSLLENAGENDALFEKTRTLILTLLKPKNIQELSASLNIELGNLFRNVASHLFFIADQTDKLEGLQVRSTEQAKECLGDDYIQKRTQCGALEQKQAAFFFPDEELSPASAAIVTIHLPHEDENSDLPVPVLVVGSTDKGYFHSSQDTLFLDFIGEVLSALIHKHLSD
jgi:uncharacterized protein YigA (DUF484 family)